MEHYSAVENKSIKKFEGKWMALENIILKKQGRHAWYALTHKWIITIKDNPCYYNL